MCRNSHSHRATTARLIARLARCGIIASFAALVSGCNAVVLNPAGDIARQQADLVLISTGLLLLIIVPVMFLTVLFAWRYRVANTEAVYEPE